MSKYFTIRSSRQKAITYSLNLAIVAEADKRKKPVADIRNIEINCKFPLPNPNLMVKGVSYVNEIELEALRREPSFTVFEKSHEFTVHEIKFQDLPEELQKSYDIEAYQQLKKDAAKAS